MAFRESYRRQVALLLLCLPHVAEEPDFALRGGTAINLFVRDFPVYLSILISPYGQELE